jgi:hypothetical protein
MGPKGLGALAKGSSTLPKGTAGGGLLAVLDQMQGMASSGTLAPSDMPAFKTVTGAVGWTTQLPVPFWNELGECLAPYLVALRHMLTRRLCPTYLSPSSNHCQFTDRGSF